MPALLSPQGKYLADFFLVPRPDCILIDVQSDLAAGLIRRLSMYKLRADVQIAPSALRVSRGLGPLPAGAFVDPRHPALGWRLYRTAEGGAQQIDWDAIRVAHCIPESGIELVPDDSYILEAGFERLHGVDFRKGCYVGQESDRADEAQEGAAQRSHARRDLWRGRPRCRDPERRWQGGRAAFHPVGRCRIGPICASTVPRER